MIKARLIVIVYMCWIAGVFGARPELDATDNTQKVATR